MAAPPPGSGYPGMSGSTPLPSDDPVLPSHLAESYARTQVAEAADTLSRTAMLSGTIERDFTSILNRVHQIGNALASTLQQSATAASSAPAGAATGGQAQPVAGEPSSPPQTVSPTQEAAKTATAAQATGSAAIEANQPPSHRPSFDQQIAYRSPMLTMLQQASNRQSTNPIVANFNEGRSTTEGLKMGTIGSLVSNGLGRIIQNSAYDDWTINEDGSYSGTDPETGQHNTVDADSEQGKQIGRHLARKTYIAAKLTSFADRHPGALGGVARAGLSASESGLVGSLGMTAARFAGPIGMAVGAVAAGGKLLESQNDAATDYRSAFGQEGTGGFAASDRFREFVAGLKGFGTIGGARARDEFKAASSLGLRGSRRDDATDFARDMYLKMGMDTSESMQLVAQSVEQGNTSLSDLSDMILEVSKSAVAAGKNSKEAIADFAAAQQVVSTTMNIGGSASTQIAGNLSAIADSLPRNLATQFGGAKGLAQMFTQTNVMNAAVMAGQDPNAALFNASNPATGAQAFGQMFQQIGDQFLTLTAATLQITVSELKRRLLKNGNRTPSPENQFPIFLQACGGNANVAGTMLQAMASMASTDFGYPNMDSAHVLMLLFAAAAGDFKDTVKGAGGAAIKRGRYAQQAEGSAGATKQVESIRKRLGYGTDAAPAGPGYNYTSGTGSTGTGGYSPYGNGGPDGTGSAAGPTGSPATGPRPQDEDAFSAYTSFANRTGTQDRAVEALLKEKTQKSLDQFAGVGDAGKVRYRVQVGGKTVEKSLAEIIADPKMRAQLDTGRADVVGTHGETRAVSEFTGISSAAQAFKKKQDANQQMVTLSPDARKLLRLLPHHGPSDAQRSGSPESGYLNPDNITPPGGN